MSLYYRIDTINAGPSVSEHAHFRPVAEVPWSPGSGCWFFHKWRWYGSGWGGKFCVLKKWKKLRVI